MKVIGITGGFKTGKSTILKFFKCLGAEVIDADKLAHRQLSDKETVESIKKNFPGGCSAIKGNIIDRRLLAQIVFKDRKKLNWLNGLIHPLVAEDIRSSLKEISRRNPQAVVAVEIPLLYEAGMEDLVDKVIVVTAETKKQIDRAIKDGFSLEDARRRIKSQLDITKKEECGDYIVNNNGKLPDAKKQILNIWKNISS